MASTAMFAPYDPASAMARRIVAPITGNAYQIDPRGSALVDVSDVAWFQTQGFSATPTAATGQSLMYAPYMADEGMTGPTTNPNTGNTYFINAAGAVAVATADIAWFQTQGYALVPTPGTGFSLMSTQVEVGQSLAGPLFSPITGNMYVMNGQGWIIAATADVAWLQGQGFAPVVSGGVAPPVFPPVVGATQATIAADFAGQQYWAAGASKASFAAWLTAIGGTYTRASSATYLQGGVVKTATANTPRFPTDSGGAPQGLRLTGSATNLLLSSNSIGDGNWTVQSGVVVTLNNAVSPDGAATATKVDLSAVVSGIGVFQLGATINGAANTKSIWIRADVAGGIVQVADPNTTVGVVNVTLTTSWQRVILLESAGSQPSTGGLWVRTSGASPGVIYLWGAQLTLTTFAVDDIYTTTATVTQAADSFSFPFTQTTYSALVGTNSQLVGTGAERILGVGNDAPMIIGSTPHFDLFVNPVFITGPTVASILASNKMMVAGNATSVAVTANGLVPVSAAGAITSAAPATATLGALTGGGANYSYGNFTQLAIWNALVASTAEMQRLTS